MSTHEQHNGAPEAARRGPPRLQVQVQTPRGLWSMTQPDVAARRPEYPQTVKVQEVIDDARAVFRFVEGDNKYTLLHNGAVLAPERPLVSYHVESGALLLLSVQGGNAERGVTQ